MSPPRVAIVDYGVGNLLSVSRGLEQCGATVAVSSERSTILAAGRVVLPGVGAFANGMSELRQRGLEDVVLEAATRGSPLLAICLGMQMLLAKSEEFGIHAGLGLIPGRVVPVPAFAADGKPQKVPHIGWNALQMPDRHGDWGGTYLHGVEPGEEVYFVHSFVARPADDRDVIANCLYGGVPLTAAIGRRNVFGCQFHPEKSGRVGLKVLRAFLAS